MLAYFLLTITTAKLSRLQGCQILWNPVGLCILGKYPQTPWELDILTVVNNKKVGQKSAVPVMTFLCLKTGLQNLRMFKIKNDLLQLPCINFTSHYAINYLPNNGYSGNIWGMTIAIYTVNLQSYIKALFVDFQRGFQLTLHNPDKCFFLKNDCIMLDGYGTT